MSVESTEIFKKLKKRKKKNRWRELDDNDDDDNEVVSVFMMVMKMSRDNGRQMGMTKRGGRGVELNLWAPLHPLRHPGCQRSTAEET